MPCVTKKKICQIAPGDAFEIVKDFKQYPQFLPWCAGARLQSVRDLDNHTQELIADLIIKYKIFSETFTTKVICNPETYDIDIEYIKGPFNHLKSYWRFYQVPDKPQSCEVEFMIDFTMKFSPLQKVMSIFFEEAMKKMIDAFDKRFTDQQKRITN